MHDVLPHLGATDFPAIRRTRLDTVQINVGYVCNQSCLHCHVNAGPKRKEIMTRETADTVIEFARSRRVRCLDITGGAPELNPNFRYLVQQARALDMRIIDRCNLTILLEPGQADLAAFLACHEVEIVASLPCYLEENVNRQRGDGVFARSIEALRLLNAQGYGVPDSPLELSLVYNPQGPVLPPTQQELEREYRRVLNQRFGITFTRLLALANLPVGRFGSTLVSKGEFVNYLDTLRGAHCPDNLEHVMCRNLLSVDWRGYVFDCDFNQMLDLPMKVNGAARMHLSDLRLDDMDGQSITVRNHCYGCTAGQGSSCGGALA